MHIVGSRGWLLIVLVFMVGAAVWASAGAAAPTGSPTVISATNGGMRPGVCPAMGEPDAPTTPKPVTKTGVMIPDPRGGDARMPGHTIGSWFHRYIRIWTTRYLGAR
jgi:hypothetical protein